MFAFGVYSFMVSVWECRFFSLVSVRDLARMKSKYYFGVFRHTLYIEDQLCLAKEG